MRKLVFDGGIAVCHIDDYYDGETHHEEFPIDSIVECLNYEVELTPSTTLRHVWNYIEAEADIIGKIFSDAMGRHSIHDFIKQAKVAPQDQEDKDPNNSMEYLEVSWGAEVYKDKDADDAKLQIYTDFHGKGMYTDESTGEVFPSGYSLSFSPINDILDCPLRINPKITITDENKTANDPPIFVGTKAWTVYDLLFAILFEITFYGSPSDQVAKLAELDQSLAEAKEAIAEGRTDYFHSLEEVDKAIQEKIDDDEEEKNKDSDSV